MSGEDYTGPDTNEVYEDEGETFESFDDMEEDYSDNSVDSVQGTHSHENPEDDDDEDEEQEKFVKASKAKKEEAKKARGQKGDDLEALDLENSKVDEEDGEDEEEEEETPKEKEKEEAPKTEEKKEEDKKAKGKPTYVTIDGETYALDSNAVISTQVDGKTEKVSLQELKNNYAGKVAYDKKFNEINLKETTFKREAQDFQEKISQFNSVKQKIEQIIKDPEKNPQDALKIFLDSTGVDSYDLMERVFKSQLTELSNVLNMEPAERKAYFLEKKNSHLLEQQKKRDEHSAQESKRNSYTQQVNALRKSFDVSEAQYVDALEELIGFGAVEKDLAEQTIVEWAATKPHREAVHTLLLPYKDQFDEGAYGELSWKLSKILLKGSETADDIKKHLAEVYGVPTEVKQLANKLNPLGRKTKPTAKPSASKSSYESFEDIEDD